MRKGFLALLLLFTVAAQAQTILFDDGTILEVPEGSEVYVSDGLVFGLSRSDRQYRFEALLPATDEGVSEFDGLEVVRWDGAPLEGVFVDGYSAKDEDGQTAPERLVNVLTPYNDSILPVGREAGFTNSYMLHLRFVGLAAKESDLSPDFTADDIGDTIGGVGNVDAWGEDVAWGEAETAIAALGDVVITPVGDYQVVQGGEGHLALRPLDDAKSRGYFYFFNEVMRAHHIGIHPITGVVWYQYAACLDEVDFEDYWSSQARGGC